MATLDYLRRAGLTVELEGERLRVTPVDRLTIDLRQFVRDHRAELLAELGTTNDSKLIGKPPASKIALVDASENKRNAWTITRNGKPVCQMVSTPCTHAEALELAKWRWPDAEVL